MFAATRRVTVLANHLSRTVPTPVTRTPSLLATAKLGSFLSTAAAASPVEMSAAKTLVDSAIKENDVLVFSKSWCPVSVRWHRRNKRERTRR